jgi:hypothetical protein
MLFLYHCLLYFYPASYRLEYGSEMTGVFRDLHGEKMHEGLSARVAFYVGELAGLVHGALQEQTRAIAGSHPSIPFSPRGFLMRSEFRFPKTVPVLMAIILAGVILAIEKATAVQASLPHSNPQLPPIQPEPFTFFPAMALIFFSAYAVAVIGWVVVFALRKSGVQRLSDIAPRN